MDTTNQETQKTKAELREKRILAKWQENKVFEKTLSKDAPKGDFVFYDGPPFATGLPHYGHFVPGSIKDAIPRYKTMQGFRVRRRWGWDCHGLPVENLIEKELGLATKKAILEHGIDRFNEVARGSVLRYANEWRTYIERMGRFVDMDNDYRTMDAQYTESVWWAFAELQKKGLVYQGFKTMQLCPRCETTLSNFEVSQGYKDITDISTYVLFPEKGRDGYYFVAWTTTPWTLPGNAALAVNPDITYVTVEVDASCVAGDGKNNLTMREGRYVLSKASYEKLFHGIGCKVLEEFPGKNLIGRTYIPPFPYYFADTTLPKKENGWQVYGAEFVTADSGTGIVHIAPAFGEDDYKLSVSYNIPFIQHVDTAGRFVRQVSDFAGDEVKPKDDHQKADVEIIKFLARKNILFAKEKITHSYPHCWRCETPLLNYASSSWFVKVTDIKDKLVKENKKVTWVPEEIGKYRFGNWLRDARDWAISRARFWGAPIPVWQSGSGKQIFVGSVTDLKSHLPKTTSILLMRHGGSLNNEKDLVSVDPKAADTLTEKGREEVRKAALKLKNQKIDYIITSTFVRTKETGRIIAEEIGLDTKNIIEDARIGEFNPGASFNGKPWQEFRNTHNTNQEKFFFIPERGGENLSDVVKRTVEFLYETNSKYEGKTVLVISHGTPIVAMQHISEGKSIRGVAATWQGVNVSNAEVREIDFRAVPRNEEGDIDLHRPFIDKVTFEKDGEVYTRVPEVFDCWFESGSMPFAETCYRGKALPEFDPKGGLFKRRKGYPADFIAEGLDQTRGWFYSMLVLGVALFGKSPYRKVIVNGLILAEDGQKMSKSKKNYPDPMKVIDTYGADTLRYLILSSSIVHGEDLRFSEKSMQEISNKIIGRLDNVLQFLEMYDNNGKLKELLVGREGKVPKWQLLDLWIKTRFNETLAQTEKGLESYELDKAVRPIGVFIDDLSNWYLKLSRDRLRDGDAGALVTLYEVLSKLSRIMAPFTPFFADDMHERLMKLGNETESESVHVTTWPEAITVEAQKDIVSRMETLRNLVTKGLEARSAAKIKIRQPLQKVISVQVKPQEFTVEERGIITEALNVKEVSIEAGEIESVKLDTTLSEDLIVEGNMRELLRGIQDARKEMGLEHYDKISLVVQNAKSAQDIVKLFSADLERAANIEKITFADTAVRSIALGSEQIAFDIMRV